jgi:hypothetical protein
MEDGWWHNQSLMVMRQHQSASMRKWLLRTHSVQALYCACYSQDVCCDILARTDVAHHDAMTRLACRLALPPQHRPVALTSWCMTTGLGGMLTSSVSRMTAFCSSLLRTAALSSPGGGTCRVLYEQSQQTVCSHSTCKQGCTQRMQQQQKGGSAQLNKQRVNPPGSGAGCAVRPQTP